MDNNNELDAKIKTVLLKDTDKAPQQLTSVWEKLDQRVKQLEMEEKEMAPKGRKFGVGIGAVAIALLLVFLFGTTPGQAAVKRVKDFLLPEKKIEQNLEGEKEETQVHLNESEKGYTIYIDQERYLLTATEGKDRISTKDKPGGDIPEVFMEIRVVKDQSPKALAGQIEAQQKAKYPDVQNLGNVDSPLTAVLIKSRSRVPLSKWNDIIERIYLVDNQKGGTIVIREHFFLEAEEGHGARFDNMLKEFRLSP